MRVDDDLDEPLLVLKDVAIGYDSSASLVNIPTVSYTHLRAHET